MTAAAPAVPFAPASAMRGAGILRAGWLAVHAPEATPRLPRRPVRVVLGVPLPAAGRVLTVIARPGQESADLGGVLYAFRRAGVRLGLLSLTRGEASPMNSTCQRLEAAASFSYRLARRPDGPRVPVPSGLRICSALRAGAARGAGRGWEAVRCPPGR
jgi:hypothetical protein